MRRIGKLILPLVCLSALNCSIGLNPSALEGSVAQAAAAVPEKGERRINFDADWRFKLGDEANAYGTGFDDSAWRKLDLPHDWSIELSFDKKSPSGNGGGCLNGGIGWYRKSFTLPAGMAGKKIIVDFDGVYMNSEVWINGQKLGEHPYGYTSFQYDLTPYLHTDGSANVLAVKVNNNQPTSRWYSGSGIERNVWLQVLDPVHIGQWGTFVTTPEIRKAADNSETAAVNAASTVVNSTAKPQQVALVSTIYDADHQLVTMQKTEKLIPGNQSGKFSQDMEIKQVKRWSVDTPVLYELKSEVFVDGKVVDTQETPFGVRSFRFDPNTGFYLNDQPMKLHGVCLHHDQGSLGAITNLSAMERQLRIMKEMGVNALRTTHNPPAPEFLDLADRMGFVVMDESFDCWETGKSKNDYHLYFKDWAERDIKSMVDRDKNHPSIVLWSMGNEIPNRTRPTALRLKAAVQSIDTTRPVTMANAGGNFDVDVADELGAVGYNYQEKLYDADHAAHPNWVIFGSETSSAVRTRGVYHLPAWKNILEHSDKQCSSYDNSVVPWGKSAEQSWIDDRDRPYVAGQFIWTGFDYIGEPTPYGDDAKSSYFGIVDTCGFPKDIYYFYKSQWTKTPTLHLLPDWNAAQKKKGEVIPVWAYTNAHTVELFLNGSSLGTQTYNPAGKMLHLNWPVAYEPGELKAVGRDERGRVVAEDVVRTTGPAAAISLKPERKSLQADGKDLLYVEVDVTDKDGNIVPDADQLLNFAVEGGTIAGVDNGDPMSFESYRAASRKAFHGKCLLIIKTEQAGMVKISAQSAAGGLRNAAVTITANAVTK